jgi:hypothetical protein
MENDHLFCSILKLMFTNGKIIVYKFMIKFIHIFTFVNHTLEIKTI